MFATYLATSMHRLPATVRTHLVNC